MTRHVEVHVTAGTREEAERIVNAGSKVGRRPDQRPDRLHLLVED
ncbi:hypothetical protein [Streptosporangium sp. CA-115845]